MQHSQVLRAGVLAVLSSAALPRPAGRRSGSPRWWPRRRRVDRELGGQVRFFTTERRTEVKTEGVTVIDDPVKERSRALFHEDGRS